MPVIDLSGIDTQLAPMKGIADVLEEYRYGALSGVETISIIDAIVTEWRQ